MHPDELTPADLFMQVSLWLYIDWGHWLRTDWEH